jgi:hypothetical protein
MANAEMVESYVATLLTELTGKSIEKDANGTFWCEGEHIPLGVTVRQLPDGETIYVDFVGEFMTLSGEQPYLFDWINTWNTAYLVKFAAYEVIAPNTGDVTAYVVNVTTSLFAEDLNRSEFEAAFKLFSSMLSTEITTWAAQVEAGPPLRLAARNMSGEVMAATPHEILAGTEGHGVADDRRQ